MATSQKLKEQAASAALKNHRNDGDKPVPEEPDTLSSSSAAHSLKYAKAEDLPSYPVVGISNPHSSANAAANLANKDHKDFEYWTPEGSASANMAAHLATGAKGPDIWKASQSQAGATAATLAAKKGVPNVPASGVLPSQVSNKTSRSASLRAATGAMSSSKSPPPVQSSPEAYPDQANAASNALKAATTMAKRSQSTKTTPGLISDSMPIKGTGARIDKDTIVPAAQQSAQRDLATAMGRTTEADRQAVLRAASVSMAKKMFAEQQRRDASNPALNAARSVRGRRSIDSDEGAPAITYGGTLDEAARKAASERLAKLHDEHAAYRTHYGVEATHKRGSLIGRARAGSEDLSDEAQARKIREQNRSLFQGQLAQVDDKKREADRAALMAAAQRNVKKQMADLDDKHAMETGRVPPSMLADWNAKAQATAVANQEARNVNAGKIHIGGDVFMEKGDVEAIAAANVAPTLTEINEKAERHRQMEEDIRVRELQRKQEIEARKQTEAVEKAEQKQKDAAIALQQKQEKDSQELHSKIAKDERKAHDKQTKEELKRAHDEMKAKEKAKKDEEKRIHDEAKAREKAQKDEEKRAHEEAKAREKADKAERKEAEKRERAEAKEAERREKEEAKHAKWLQRKSTSGLASVGILGGSRSQKTEPVDTGADNTKSADLAETPRATAPALAHDGIKDPEKYEQEGVDIERDKTPKLSQKLKALASPKSHGDDEKNGEQHTGERKPGPSFLGKVKAVVAPHEAKANVDRRSPDFQKRVDTITNAHEASEADRERRNEELEPTTGLDKDLSVGKEVLSTGDVPEDGAEAKAVDEGMVEGKEPVKQEKISEPSTSLHKAASPEASEGLPKITPLQESTEPADIPTESERQAAKKLREQVASDQGGDKPSDTGMSTDVVSHGAGTDSPAQGLHEAATRPSATSHTESVPSHAEATGSDRNIIPTSTEGQSISTSSQERRPQSPPKIGKRGSSLGFIGYTPETADTTPAGAQHPEETGFGHERRAMISEAMSGETVGEHDPNTAPSATVGKASDVDALFAASGPGEEKEVILPHKEAGTILNPESTPQGIEATTPSSVVLEAAKSPTKLGKRRTSSSATGDGNDGKHRRVRGWLKSKVNKIGSSSKLGKSSENDEEAIVSPPLTAPSLQDPPAVTVSGTSPITTDGTTSQTSLRDLAMVGRQPSKPSSVAAIKDGQVGDVAPPHSTDVGSTVDTKSVNTRDFATPRKAYRSPSISSDEVSRPPPSQGRGRSVSPISLDRGVTEDKFVDAPERQISGSKEQPERMLNPKLSNLSGTSGTPSHTGIKLERKESGASPARDSKFKEEL